MTKAIRLVKLRQFIGEQITLGVLFKNQKGQTKSHSNLKRFKSLWDLNSDFGTVLVRSPRFEPGSSAWQADVLDQTRLRPPELE